MKAELPPGIDDLIAAIRDDREHGASWLARQALRAAGACAGRSTATTSDELLDVMRACTQSLVASRPGMAPVRCWLDRLQTDVEALVGSGDDVSALRQAIVEGVGRLVGESERASHAAAENAVGRVAAGSIVFTASLSQTILEACQLAWEKGKLQQVLAAESTDSAGHRYGDDVASALRARAIPVEVVADALIPRRVTEANRIWLGADSVLADGSALNGSPSRALAAAAHLAGRPVEVICESAKIDCWTDPAAISVPPGFDRIPADLVDAVVTERGALPPADVAVMCLENVGEEYLPPRPLTWEEEMIHSGSADSGQADEPGERRAGGGEVGGEGACLLPGGGRRARDDLSRPSLPRPPALSVEGGTPTPPNPGKAGQLVGDGDEVITLVARIAEKLIARKENLAVAEAAAGGQISDLLTDRPGSSAWFAGGMIPYSNAGKQFVAGVPAEDLARFGAVSAETALALAEGARRVFAATWGIGETGIAGPQTGRRSSKPAGLSYVAVVGPGDLRRTRLVNTGVDSRIENKRAFAVAALSLLLEELEKTP